MSDYQINNLFNQIDNILGEYKNKHFIITKNTLDSKLDFLDKIHIDDFSEIEGIIDTLIEIKKKFNEESDESLRLRKEIEESEKEIKCLTEQLDKELSENKKKDIKLKREAVKYYSKGHQQQIEKKLSKAVNAYDSAIDLKPNYHEAFYNSGIALTELAESKKGQDAENLLLQACDKFHKATKIKKDKHEAFNNWGNALSNLAKIKTSQDSQGLLYQACDKYQKATEIKEDQHRAFNNWGVALSDLAENKNNKETDGIFRQAFRKFEEATEIKKDKHEAFNNWGDALIRLAKSKKNDKIEAEKIFQQAEVILLKAVELGADTYNISCVYALTNEKKLSLKYLEKSLSIKGIASKDVEKDSDWDNYRNDKEFLELLNIYK